MLKTVGGAVRRLSKSQIAPLNATMMMMMMMIMIMIMMMMMMIITAKMNNTLFVDNLFTVLTLTFLPFSGFNPYFLSA